MRPATTTTARNPPKKPVNVTVRQDLLKDARAASINLSETLETALREKLRKHQEETWLRENAVALEKYSEFVNRVGVFSDLVTQADTKS